MNKIIISLLVVNLVLGVAGLFLPVISTKLGGTTNLSDLALSGQLTSAGVVNTSGTTIGSGTTLVTAVCSATAKTIGALLINATTTFDLTLTGATTSQNQAYFVGNSSSSINNGGLQFVVAPSSTTGVVSVLARALNQGWGGATTTISVCYLQF